MYRNPLVKGSARQLLLPAPLSANGGLEPNQPVRLVLDTTADFLGGNDRTPTRQRIGMLRRFATKYEARHCIHRVDGGGRAILGNALLTIGTMRPSNIAITRRPVLSTPMKQSPV